MDVTQIGNLLDTGIVNPGKSNLSFGLFSILKNRLHVM